jgi:hypothetical protein
MPESNSRMHSEDWPFVQRILDLTEGHSNAQRARMIMAVLSQRRRADLVKAVSEVTPRSSQERPLGDWLSGNHSRMCRSKLESVFVHRKAKLLQLPTRNFVRTFAVPTCDRALQACSGQRSLNRFNVWKEATVRGDVVMPDPTAILAIGQFEAAGSRSARKMHEPLHVKNLPRGVEICNRSSIRANTGLHAI